MPVARRLLDSWAATPVAWIIGHAGPSSAASCSRKNPPPVMTDSVLPSRPITRSRRLARTESPTSSAPASTAVAVATPSSTARLVRQNHARLRANRVEVRMPQLVLLGESGGQVGAVGHNNQDRL